MSPGLGATLSVALVSLASGAGYLLVLGRAQRLRKAIFVMVAFAVGALFGDVFLHVLPELMASPDGRSQGPWFIMAGLMLFFGLEKFMRWRHCHVPEKSHRHPVVTLSVVGDGAHNLLDGLMIGSAWQLSPSVGLATSVAVLMHEIPQELGDLGVLMAAGLKPRQALWVNGLTSLTAFAGLGLSFWLPQLLQGSTQALSAMAAGGFLYLAGSDLVPELHHELDARRSTVQFGGILAGLGVMGLIKVLFPAS